jgi:hypothetical protein
LRTNTLWLLLGFFGCLSCGSKTSPTAATPTNSSTPTRIISISGTLDFGPVPVGQEVSKNFDIRNDGNATLTVTSATVVGTVAGGAIRGTWAGDIAAGSVRRVTVFFAPTEIRSYDNTLPEWH